MVDHGQRDHATWSASATARNWNCPGALALSVSAKPQRESIHSARGTACHQIAEKCLRGGLDPSSFLGAVEKTKEMDVTIDEELVASAEAYVDYVRAQPATSVQVEQRFSLDALNGPFDAGGTADAVLYYELGRRLEVVDLKNGMGLVDVRGNPQLRTYALGALLANPKLRVDTVTVTIVQPRPHHKDGRIRTETFHVADLIDWTADLLEAMGRSKAALDEHAWIGLPREGDYQITADVWTERWLRPGRCKFCPAEGWCPALRKSAHAVAGLWFDDMDRPKLNGQPLQSPEAVAKDLEALDMLEDWIKARRAYAHALADAGTPPPGWKLVDSFGHRKWGAAEGRVVADLKAVAGLDPDDVYDRKLKTPAAIDKILGKAGANKITSMWLKPVSGRTLVRAEATDRPAAAGVAERYFQQEN